MFPSTTSRIHNKTGNDNDDVCTSPEDISITNSGFGGILSWDFSWASPLSATTAPPRHVDDGGGDDDDARDDGVADVGDAEYDGDDDDDGGDRRHNRANATCADAATDDDAPGAAADVPVAATRPGAHEGAASHPFPA